MRFAVDPFVAAGVAYDGVSQRFVFGDRHGRKVRVVSMPNTSAFDRQEAAYKASVLPKGLPRVAVEAGVTGGWYKYVGLEGAVVGLDRFGESAPAGVLFKEFGFTAENVAKAVKSVL